MTATFVETAKPTMMLTGGTTSPPEVIGTDPVTAAAWIASGAGGSVGSWSGPSAPTLTRVQFTGAKGPIMVNNRPPMYAPGEIAGFDAVTAAALIASGAAVSN